jgi:hypothetical protein
MDANLPRTNNGDNVTNVTGGDKPRRYAKNVGQTPLQSQLLQRRQEKNPDSAE